MAFCPNLTELTLSAGWLGDDVDSKEWHHKAIERIGLRDLSRREDETSESLLDTAERLMSTYRQSSSLFEWSVETLLGLQVAAPEAQLQFSSKIIKVFLGLKSSTSAFGEGWKDRAFPSLKSISVIDCDIKEAISRSRNQKTSAVENRVDTREQGPPVEAGRFVQDLEGGNLSPRFKWTE